MNKLMCHVVAGYPDTQTCLQLMEGMANLGVAAIEVQIPFSDPIADGETIMRANDAALEGGTTTAASFELIREARKQGVKSDIYIMSYIQKVQHFGFEEFCEAAKKCAAKGLITPDLPYDSPEYAAITKLAVQRKLELVPVLSPGMPEERLKKLLEMEPPSVYVTSQRGITGNAYAGTEELGNFIQDIKAQSGARVMIGFGISTLQDVADAQSIGDIAIVGSAIINQLRDSDVERTLDYINGLSGAAA